MRAFLGLLLAVLVATAIGVAAEAAAGAPTYGPARARYRADFPGFPVVRAATVDGVAVTVAELPQPSGDYAVWTAVPPGRGIPSLRLSCPSGDFCGGWTGYAPLQAARPHFVLGGTAASTTEIAFDAPGRHGDELLTDKVVVHGVRFLIVALGPQAQVATFVSSVRPVR